MLDARNGIYKSYLFLGCEHLCSGSTRLWTLQHGVLALNYALPQDISDHPS